MYVCLCVCVCVLKLHWGMCVCVCVCVLRSHWDVCVMDLILIQMGPKGPTGSATRVQAASSGQQRLLGLTFPGPLSLPKCRTTIPASSREDCCGISGEDARMRMNSCQGPRGRVMTRSRRSDSGLTGTHGANSPWLLTRVWMTVSRDLRLVPRNRSWKEIARRPVIARLSLYSGHVDDVTMGGRDARCQGC